MSRLLDALKTLERTGAVVPPSPAPALPDSQRPQYLPPGVQESPLISAAWLATANCEIVSSATLAWSGINERLAAVEAWTDELQQDSLAPVVSAAMLARNAAPAVEADLSGASIATDAPRSSPMSTLPAKWELPAIAVRIAYRSVAGQIAKDLNSINGPLTILIAGCQPPTLSGFQLLELAAALADDGQPVLAIDTQRVTPATTVHPVDQSLPGLGEVASELARWSDVIRPTTIPGVSFVGAGVADEPHSERAAQSVWTRLPGSFRYMLVHASAAEPVNSMAWARPFRAAYLLAEQGIDTRGALERAIARCRALELDVRGLIPIDTRRSA